MESEAYTQGREAYSDDKKLADNPHAAGTAEHGDWERGYKNAEKNDPLAPHNMED
jgi:hypothetical protein